MKCCDATLLVSEARDRKLRRAERARLRLHLLICPSCSRFEKQLPALGDAARRLAERTDSTDL